MSRHSIDCQFRFLKIVSLAKLSRCSATPELLGEPFQLWFTAIQARRDLSERFLRSVERAVQFDFVRFRLADLFGLFRCCPVHHELWKFAFDSPNPSSKRHPFFRLTFLFVKSLLHVDHSWLVLIFGLPCFMRQKRFLSLAIDAFKIRLPRMRNFEQMIPNIESALEVVDRSTWSIFMSSCSSPASFSKAENYWSTNFFLSLDRFLHLDSLDSSFSADDSALNCVGVWAEIIEASAQSCLSASHCCWGTVPRVNVAADEGLHDFYAQSRRMFQTICCQFAVHTSLGENLCACSCFRSRSLGAQVAEDDPTGLKHESLCIDAKWFEVM